MARKGIASIGVDLGARELKAVEVSTDGQSVKHFASSLLPPLGVDMGIPTDPNTLSEAFRTLFRELNPDSKGIVFGLPASAVTTRVLDIPTVPDNELRTILEGEVQHFGIVRGFGGMFDYQKLIKPAGEKDTEPQALVMACEGVQLNVIRDAAERARLERCAIEPSMLGLIRLAAVHHNSAEPAMLVAVSGDIAEIAVSIDHRLRLYRRLELAAENSEDAFMQGMKLETDDAVPAFLRAEAGTGVGNQLVIELKRTLDYVRREFDASGTLKKVILAISTPKEAPLASLLEENLELEVELAKAPLPGDDGYRFASAYGLALGSAFPDIGVPLFDLSPFDPVEAERQRQRKILAGSLVASITIILASMAGVFYFAKQAGDVEHHTADEQMELSLIQKNSLPDAMARQTKLEHYRALSASGVPVPQIVDALTEVLDSRTGVNQIEISGSQIKLDAEAADEASMIQTLDQIRVKEGFRSAFIESFDQQPDPTRRVVKFKLSAQLGKNGNQP